MNIFSDCPDFWQQKFLSSGPTLDDYQDAFTSNQACFFQFELTWLSNKADQKSPPLEENLPIEKIGPAAGSNLYLTDQMQLCLATVKKNNTFPGK